MSIPSWAYRGAKVVCVTKATNAIILRHNHPLQNGIYTIRKVVFCDDGGVALLLNEVVNLTWDPGLSQREPAFGVKHFRPVHDLKSDLANHFQALLNVSNPEQVEA